MKRITMMAVLATLCLSTVAFAQDQNKVLVDKSLLTQTQLAQANAANTTAQVNSTLAQVKEVGQYAGIGKEIGEGVNGALSAITDNANKFANTGVGRFTMWMVAFKILGNKAIRLLISLLMILIVTGVFAWIYSREFMPRRVLTKEAGSGKERQREWKVYPDLDEQGAPGSLSLRDERTFYVVAFLVFLLIAAAVGGC